MWLFIKFIKKKLIIIKLINKIHNQLQILFSNYKLDCCQKKNYKLDIKYISISTSTVDGDVMSPTVNGGVYGTDGVYVTGGEY